MLNERPVPRVGPAPANSRPSRTVGSRGTEISVPSAYVSAFPRPRRTALFCLLIARTLAGRRSPGAAVGGPCSANVGTGPQNVGGKLAYQRVWPI